MTPDDAQTRLGDAVRAALRTVERTDDVALKREVARDCAARQSLPAVYVGRDDRR